MAPAIAIGGALPVQAACAGHSLLRAEPGCDELRRQRGANLSCSEQGWGGLSSPPQQIGSRSRCGKGSQGLWVSPPTYASFVISFADLHRGGENHHHPAAFPHHAGGFLVSGLGLHLHIGSCAESTAGAGQGQQPSTGLPSPGSLWGRAV